MKQIVNKVEARSALRYNLRYMAIKEFEIAKLKTEIEIERSERKDNGALEVMYDNLSEELQSLNFIKEKIKTLNKILELSKLI